MIEIYLSNHDDIIILHVNGYFIFEDRDFFTHIRKEQEFILNQCTKIGEFEE